MRIPLNSLVAAPLIWCVLTGCATTNKVVDHIQALSGHKCETRCTKAHLHSWQSLNNYPMAERSSNSNPSSTNAKPNIELINDHICVFLS